MLTPFNYSCDKTKIFSKEGFGAEKTPLVGIKNSTQSLSFNVSEEKILISNGVNEAATKYLNIIIAKMLFHFALLQHLSAMGYTSIKSLLQHLGGTKNIFVPVSLQQD